MVCWHQEVLAYCHYLRYSARGTGRGGREWGRCRYLCEGLSTRVYGGEAERRSRDAWGKRVSSATRVGHHVPHPHIMSSFHFVSPFSASPAAPAKFPSLQKALSHPYFHATFPSH